MGNGRKKSGSKEKDDLMEESRHPDYENDKWLVTKQLLNMRWKDRKILPIEKDRKRKGERNREQKRERRVEQRGDKKQSKWQGERDGSID